MLSLKCSCGAIRGKIEPVSRSLNRRFVCMCKDCQAFAHYLGKKKEMLDPNGGTEVVPVHPARIQFTQGQENITCVRLSDDGITRWYSRCCKTPIANTPSAKLPFAGVHRSIIESPEELGPIYARVNGKYGYPPFPKGTSKNSPPKLFLSVIKFMLVGKVKKLGTPWPFPRVKPPVLSDEEYYKLIELCS